MLILYYTPILEADDVHKSGWHGTWVGALASWLSRGVVREWDPAHVIEHRYLARVEDGGDVHLCRVVKNRRNADLHTQGGADCRLVEVEVVWLTRHVRTEWVTEYGSVVRPIEQWLQSKGGSGGGRCNRSVSGSPYGEWLWCVEDQQVDSWNMSDRVPITSLIPVSEVDVAESWGINGHGEVVLVDEPSQWWLNAEWKVPQTEWMFPRERVVGLQFRDTTTPNSQVNRARQAWLRTLHTQAHRWAQAPPQTPVLYSYPDCSLDRAGGYVRVSYGWVTTGVANQHLVREVTGWSTGQRNVEAGP